MLVLLHHMHVDGSVSWLMQEVVVQQHSPSMLVHLVPRTLKNVIPMIIDQIQ